jgi:hypothetical protein
MKTFFALILGCVALPSMAQTSCSSDGEPVPQRVLERFTSADCDSCWAAPAQHATPVGVANTDLILDWIVPGAQGEAAPMAGIARRDALYRLQELGKEPPTTATHHTTVVQPRANARLRVAHGPAEVNYVGAAISLSPADPGPWTAVLLLVEDIAAGENGSPIARQVVRNSFSTDWRDPTRSVDSDKNRWYDMRAMSLPTGVRFDRLHAVGLLLDAQAGMVAAVRSACLN